MADPRVLAALPLAAAKLRREAQVKRQLQALPDGELNRLVLTSRAARLLEADGRPADNARLYGLADRLLTDRARRAAAGRPSRPGRPAGRAARRTFDAGDSRSPAVRLALDALASADYLSTGAYVRLLLLGHLDRKGSSKRGGDA